MRKQGLLLALFAMIMGVQPVTAKGQPATTITYTANSGQGAPVEAADDQSPESRKLALEIEQLELENRNLLEAQSWVRTWVVPLVTVIAGIIGTAAAWWTARRSRFGVYDQKVLAKRLEKYEELVASTRPLALYFPEHLVSKSVCSSMGQELRTCFFSGTGIVLSEEARIRYMTLERALVAATAADSLDVPGLSHYSTWISEHKINEYRKVLGIAQPPRTTGPRRLQWSRGPKQPNRKIVDAWVFGQNTSPDREKLENVLRAREQSQSNQSEAAAKLFQDFVLLQALASWLRTALAEDLRGRRRPG